MHEKMVFGDMKEARIKDEEFGKRLLGLRKKEGLSRAAAAKKIGIGLSSLQEYEKGYLPIPSKLEKISLYYKRSKSWFLTGINDLSSGDDLPPGTIAPAQYIKEGTAAWPTAGSARITGGGTVAAAGEAQKINVNEAMGKAYEILHSGTPYAVALYLNIQQFSAALGATGELKVCQDRITDLQAQVDVIRNEINSRPAVHSASSDQQVEPLEKEAM